MKKYYLITVTTLLTLFIGVTSCNKDAFEPLPDYGAMPENTRINHKNPVTGEDYTKEELEALDYDPLKEEFYELEQPVELSLVTNIRPSKVEVVGPDGTIMETIVDFSPFGDELISSIFSTTVTALGIEAGENARINFKSYFTFGEGLAIINTKFKVTFKGESKNEPTGFELVRQSGENEFLPLKDFVNRDLQVFENLRYGYSYEASNEWGVVPDEDNLLDFRKTDNFTIAFWVRSDVDTSDPEMVADQDWDSSGNPGITIAYRGDNWRAVASDGNNKADADADFVFFDGNGAPWHLLAVTFDRGGDMVMYNDGVEANRSSMAGIGSIDSGFDLHIAQDGTGTYGDAFPGDIAETRIFDWALSAQEIHDLSKEPTFPVLLKKSSGELIALPTILNNVEGVSSFEDGQIKGYDFTEAGVNQYVTIDDEETGYLDFRYESDFSVSFWVNSTSEGDDPEMFADQDWDDGDNIGLTIAYKAGRMELAYGDGSSKAGFTTDGNNPPRFNDGNWHLITATFDRGDVFTLYQDDVEVAKRDITAYSNINSGFPLRIAQDGTGIYSPFFKGKIAGVVIYDYVLSAGEVSARLNELN